MSASRQNTSRFQNTESLKTVSLLMEDLYKKEIELARDAKLNGPDSIDHKKYLVVTTFVNDVNSLIELYNAEPEPNENSEKLRHLVVFATHLQTISQNTLDKHTNILLEPRNNKRENANKATQALILGSAGPFRSYSVIPNGCSCLHIWI